MVILPKCVCFQCKDALWQLVLVVGTVNMGISWCAGGTGNNSFALELGMQVPSPVQLLDLSACCPWRPWAG